MDKSANKICPLCGNSDTSHFADCTDHEVSGETYTLFRCSHCGLIHTDNPPVGEERAAYSKLEQELGQAHNPQKLLEYLFFHMRFFSIRWKRRLVEEVTRMKRGRLLNYGAGSGYFSSRMSDRGWHVTSLEEHHEKRIFSLEMFHHRMMELSEIDSLARQSFDAITLWHTLEHQDNPDSLADKFTGILKPNGLIFIAVPNTDSYDAAYYGRYWAAWDVPRHRWHFNPESMVQFGCRHGLVLMHHRKMPLDVFYISLLSERNKGGRFWFMKGLMHGTAFWLKSVLHRDRSSSLVYVFKKA